jgi:hypothetical protein
MSYGYGGGPDWPMIQAGTQRAHRVSGAGLNGTVTGPDRAALRKLHQAPEPTRRCEAPGTRSA